MSGQAICVVRLFLFKHSQQSFIAALDDAQINHERIELYSSETQASGIVETITALSDAMPWSSLAKVIIAWIDAKKSREVIIQTDDGRVIHAKGYSANEIQHFLPLSVNVTVIETDPSEKT